MKTRRRSEDFPNPFLVSGALRLARASIVFLVGLFVLFQALAAFRNEDTALFLLAAFAASVLVLSGLTGFKQAIDRLTGYEPDPRSPADLVKRKQDGKDASSIGRAHRYTADEISEMMEVGTPPEGSGHSGLLGRLAQLFLPGLRFSPPEIRLLVEYIFACLIGTLIILGLAIFFLQASKTVGLEFDTAVSGLFWWVLATVLLARWRLFVRPSTLTMQLAQMRNASPGTLQGLIFFLALLAIGGVLVAGIDTSEMGIYSDEARRILDAFVPSVPIGLIGLILVLAAALVTMTVFFWFIRMQRLKSLSGELDEDVTQIRFQRDGVGNSKHFSEALMTALQDTYSDENTRIYNNAPRVYAETQPTLQRAPLAKFVPFLAEGAGNVLLLLAALNLGFRMPDVANINSISNVVSAGMEPSDTAMMQAWSDMANIGPWLLGFLILGGFGKWFLGLSEVFLGETNFRSLLVRAQLSGAETEVRQAIGSAAFDTFQTEVSVPFTNGVVEGGSVVLHTCSFARPNRNGLMGPRSILEFGRDQGELKRLVDAAVRSLDELRFMPQLQNRDVAAVQDAIAINTQHAQAVYHPPENGQGRLPGSPARQTRTVSYDDDPEDDNNRN